MNDACLSSLLSRTHTHTFAPYSYQCSSTYKLTQAAFATFSGVMIALCDFQPPLIFFFFYSHFWIAHNKYIAKQRSYYGIHWVLFFPKKKQQHKRTKSLIFVSPLCCWRECVLVSVYSVYVLCECVFLFFFFRSQFCPNFLLSSSCLHRNQLVSSIYNECRWIRVLFSSLENLQMSSKHTQISIQFHDNTYYEMCCYWSICSCCELSDLCINVLRNVCTN